MPQTRFVLTKALEVGLKPIVVINKIDRPDARPTEVVDEVFDLFAALDASEEQLDFPILYGSAKQGWMAAAPAGPKDKGMRPLFDPVVRHVAPPTVEEGPLRMLGTILEAIRISGASSPDACHRARRTQPANQRGGTQRQPIRRRATKVLASAASSARRRRVFRRRHRLRRRPARGDRLGHVVRAGSARAAPVAADRSPTLAMPSASTIPARRPRRQHVRAARSASGCCARRSATSPCTSPNRGQDSMEVAGRGVLHLSILIETMRREGFELSVSRPKVLFKNGVRRAARADRGGVDRRREQHAGIVVQKMAERKGELIEMRPSAAAACGSSSMRRRAASSAITASCSPTRAAPR